MKKQNIRKVQGTKYEVRFIVCLSFLILNSTFLISNCFSQNNDLTISGAYITLSGGTQTAPIYLVVGQSNPLGIVRTSGHISSEGQYNFVKWTSGANTGSYVFPFGVGGNSADYIPFIFNKTTSGNSDISTSTWTTNPQNMPHPDQSDVAPVSTMVGIPDSVNNAIDRFWDIEAPSPITGDLTFSYRGIENTTIAPADTFKTQHWNGTAWDNQVGPGNPGVTTGIGTVGPIIGQTTFSPWVLTRAILSTNVVNTQNAPCNSQCSGSATIASFGGTTPYTYAWNPIGQSTQTATGLCAGTYSVIVTDGSGSTTINTVTITEPAALTNTISSTANVSCNGGNNGAAAIATAGGSPSYTYSWNTIPSQTSSNATGLSAGNYSVTVTDNKGCATTASVAITEPTVLTSTISASTPAGCTVANGTATANPTGGTAGYTYSWTPGGQTTQIASGFASNITYTALITDNNGCTASSTVSITASASPSVTANSTQADCTAPDGTATANPSGGTGAYTYLWNPSSQTSPTATGLVAGNYSVSVTDANGCSQTQTVAVSSVNTLSISTTSTQAGCTVNNGTAMVNPNSGVSPYTYNWSNGFTTQQISNLGAGTYSAIVTDANGCVQTQTVNVSTVNNTLTVTASSTTTNCTASIGTATANTSGGVGAYTYLWNPSSQTSPTATGLVAGNYSVSVTDANGCSQTQTVAVSSVNTLSISTTSTQAGCTVNNGTATVNPVSGTSPYTYNWSNGSTTQQISNLTAGNYSTTVTDANGCTASSTVSVIATAGPSVTANSTQADCTAPDGTATANPSGGTGAYTYLWNPSSQTSPTATGLVAGNYSVSVTDANGCSQTQTVAVSSVNTLSISTTSTQAGCTVNNGTATVNPSSGASPYTYLWNPSGQNSQTATGLSVGNYTATVIDANGCIQTQTVSVSTVNNTLTVTASSTTTNCTASIGTATANASGGVGAYTYLWSNASTTQQISNLGAGNYSVSVIDANGCAQTQTVSVNSVNTLSISTTSTQAGCTVNNGTAMVNPNSGASPYTYNWSNGFTTQQISNLGAGTYSATVTDANGCVQTQTVSVTNLPGPSASASASPSTITLGDSTQLLVTSTTTSVTYSWSPTTGLSCTTCANPTATPSTTTGYCVLVTDANGCSDSACITINVDIPCDEVFIPTAFSPNYDGHNEMECVNGNCIKSMHFVIYDRWGEKVFETTDQKICWDGMYKGELENTGVFVYDMEATLTNGQSITKKGNISLIR